MSSDDKVIIKDKVTGNTFESGLDDLFERKTKEDMVKQLFKSFINWSFNDEDFVVVLDRCLEWLRDHHLLNDDGKAFAHGFWTEYICLDEPSKSVVPIETVKCDRCTNWATHINEPNPYSKEINNEVILCNLCDDCWRDSCDEI